MISTVECEVEQGTGMAQILRATFPMGSMTGAPKERAMELISTYEKPREGGIQEPWVGPTRRGISI
jgi:para-aminobenzoate synthetase component 1